MKCGHDLAIDADKVTAPACWCGETTIARTLGAPAPRITGHARGVVVASTYLGPTAVDLTTDGPLTLKPDVEPALITIGERLKAAAARGRRRHTGDT